MSARIAEQTFYSVDLFTGELHSTGGGRMAAAASVQDIRAQMGPIAARHSTCVVYGVRLY